VVFVEGLTGDLYLDDPDKVEVYNLTFRALGECVEVSALDGMVMVRDSKAPQAGTLSFNADEFRSFVRGVVAGEFNDLADS